MSNKLASILKGRGIKCIPAKYGGYDAVMLGANESFSEASRIIEEETGVRPVLRWYGALPVLVAQKKGEF